MWDAGKRCFEAAGVGPEDVDVAELHDAFTISILLGQHFDALGITKPGEAGAFMRSGQGTLGGRCPVNTHGGLLSQAHVGGILHLVEAVRMRGEAGRRQVEDARLALVSGNGGISRSAAKLMEKV